MKATELRIGNLVNYQYKPLEINEPFYKIENGADILVHENHNVFKPIPLTEELMVKFGLPKIKITDGYYYTFKKHGTVYVFAIDEKYNKDNGNCGYLGIFNHSGEMHFFMWHIKYAHEFQNIYFVLTETELPIK